MRPFGYSDLVFELKLVRRKELGLKGKELRAMDDDELGRLTPVADALTEARDQIAEYRAALAKKFGASTLRLRSYVVVAVGLERMLGEEHP